MTSSKTNQQLRHDLKEAAATLKWASVDMFGVAKRMLANGDEQGANELMKIAFSFQETEDKLVAYEEEVKGGRITRVAEQKK